MFLSLLTLLLFLSFSMSALAQDAGGQLGGADTGGRTSNAESGGRLPEVSGSVTLQNPLDDSISSIPDFFKAVIDILLVFAIPFVVFFIIWAGFLYVTARGNPTKIQQAHSALLYALVGGLLILGANLLLDIITNTVTQVTQ